MRARAVVVLVAGLLIPAGAMAAPTPAPTTRGVDYQIVPPAPRDVHRNANGPDTLFLNRCVGGCTVLPGGNDARTNHSSIPTTTANLSEFPFSDDDWNAVVACVTETYQPYGVDVVTTEPASGDYVEAMVAGTPDQMGLDATTLGIAPMTSDCTPQASAIAFAFAGNHGGQGYLLDLCATVAHEAGHVYGLDHEFDCKDPMTYLVGCGQKYFLNVAAPCGEFDGPRNCRCTGPTQNSHVKLSAVLGVGTLPAGPTVTIPYPADGAMVDNSFSIFGEVAEDRVLDRVEFWLNGWPWKTEDGDRDRDTYSYTAPANLPDGVIDVEVRAYNDLELMGVDVVTVTKGEACTSAATCLDGQQCSDGRCAWPEPTGEIGDACERDADCMSRKCGSDGNVQLCTDYCLLGIEGSCGDGYSCLAAGADTGVCWPSELTVGEPTGCCSAGEGAGGGPAPWLLGA
ncbi:MAG: hypothetical protein KC464_22945, partial [Myxococcales bacterium]|nr:hypothetical protein [Myxococcales bacterium]